MNWRSSTLLAVTRVALAASIGLAPVGCAKRRTSEPVDWSAGDVIRYRLVTKGDFWSRTSNSAWGNFAHSAEICTHIVPADDHEQTGRFHAVMKRECSFWNKVIGPLGYISRLVGLAFGIITFGGGKQPDSYILQHEQVHFAINEVAARKLSARLAGLTPSQRSSRLVERTYSLTLSHASKRHHEFDSETSGTYDPSSLEKWVRVLELQMEEVCGTEPQCRVRIRGG